jgi:hypothetical protein
MRQAFPATFRVDESVRARDESPRRRRTGDLLVFA